MNVFSTKKKIHLRFDIKGSKLGREVLKAKEKMGLDYENVLGKYNYALKDLDFEFFKKEIHIDAKVRDKIILQLTKDSELLRELNINDYSLLLGIHKKKMKKKISLNNSVGGENDDNNINNNDINSENLGSNISNYSFSSKDKENQKEQEINSKTIKDEFSSERITISSINKSIMKNITEDKFNRSENNNENKKEENELNNFVNDNKDIILEDGGILNEKENEIYYMGIIDILTNYDCVKVGEFVYKSVRYCTKTMSCVSPTAYQERFIKYLKQIIPPNYNNKDENNEIKNENVE